MSAQQNYFCEGFHESKKEFLHFNHVAFFKMIDDSSEFGRFRKHLERSFPEDFVIFLSLGQKALSLHSSVFFKNLVELGMIMDPNPFALFFGCD